MNENLDVAFLPATLDPASLAGRCVVVVDILRATTTIVTALNHGATCVIPSPSVEGARQLRLELGDGSVLGGERGGIKVDGFECGNSPFEYTSEAIGGKQLILATTNGTIAMEACRQAQEILIGAFVNLNRVFDRTRNHASVTILCAGTRGFVTGEDVLFAGALTEKLKQERSDWELTDAAQITLQYWKATEQQYLNDNLTLADALRKTRGGKNLIRIGQDADIEYCSQIDHVPVLPLLDEPKWSIELV